MLMHNGWILDRLSISWAPVSYRDSGQAMNPLQLFDTYERKVRIFEPLNAGLVGIYACGPTVYNYAHIGNLRTYLFEDILRRVLEFNGYQVQHVMNITDVGHLTSDADTGEDKMELGSKRTGMTAWQMADFYGDAFKADLALLNILMPDVWCKATDHIIWNHSPKIIYIKLKHLFII